MTNTTTNSQRATTGEARRIREGRGARFSADREGVAPVRDSIYRNAQGRMGRVGGPYPDTHTLHTQ